MPVQCTVTVWPRLGVSPEPSSSTSLEKGMGSVVDSQLRARACVRNGHGGARTRQRGVRVQFEKCVHFEEREAARAHEQRRRRSVRAHVTHATPRANAPQCSFGWFTEGDDAEAIREAYHEILEVPCHVVLASQPGMGGLLIGSKLACTEAAVMQHNVGAIVQTAKELEVIYPAVRRALAQLELAGAVAILRLGWDDDIHFNVGTNIAEAVAWIHARRREGANVLVNCAQGKSRSATLVIAYLLCADPARFPTFQTAFDFLHGCRAVCDPNPAFQHFLQTSFVPRKL